MAADVGRRTPLGRAPRRQPVHRPSGLHPARFLRGVPLQLARPALERYDFAIDFQGLIKSALTATFARPDGIFGFHQAQIRERAAGLFYSRKTLSSAVHVVDRNLDLAAAAGATAALRKFPLPLGAPEGRLPKGEFVLASPLAGWAAKQWPMDRYLALNDRLRRELGMPLVFNGPAGIRPRTHLRTPRPDPCDATRRSRHWRRQRSAASRGGPLRNRASPSSAPPIRHATVPTETSIKVLRSSPPPLPTNASAAVADSMRAISPGAVFETLKSVLCSSSPSPTPTR